MRRLTAAHLQWVGRGSAHRQPVDPLCQRIRELKSLQVPGYDITPDSAPLQRARRRGIGTLRVDDEWVGTHPSKTLLHRCRSLPV